MKVSKTTGKTDMSDRTKEAMLAVKYDCESAILGTQVPNDSAIGNGVAGTGRTDDSQNGFSDGLDRLTHRHGIWRNPRISDCRD